jgi:hypothetical protein
MVAGVMEPIPLESQRPHTDACVGRTPGVPRLTPEELARLSERTKAGHLPLKGEPCDCPRPD